MCQWSGRSKKTRRRARRRARGRKRVADEGRNEVGMKGLRVCKITKEKEKKKIKKLTDNRGATRQTKKL